LIIVPNYGDTNINVINVSVKAMRRYKTGNDQENVGLQTT